MQRWRFRASSTAHRRLGRRWLWPIITLALVALIIADRQGLLLVRQVDDLATYHGAKASVVRVIDGDTLEVALPDALNGESVTRVRLWGIDAPEIGRFGRADDPLAREAAALVESLLSISAGTVTASPSDDRAASAASPRSSMVLLFLEPHQQRDSFARILAHIELPDGRSINEALLEAGLAVADDRWAHSRLTRYAQVENLARRRGVGMWGK